MEDTSFCNLLPVAPEVYGEGYPYAPEWPEQGDVWGWRTGRRIVPNGTHFQDRYLYLPNRLVRLLNEEKDKDNSGSASKCKHIFASKLAVERYLKNYFPDADFNAFFASFSWKIRALSSASAKAPISAVPLQQIAQAPIHSHGGDVAKCKANNNKCTSLVLEEVEKYSPAMPCNICCSEAEFCRDCSCILCCKTVSTAYGGYSYMKCPVNDGEGVCGHVAHLDCALRCLLAGHVGGSIGLDVEYHCRRCDGRTDLFSHVHNLLQTSKTTDLDDEIRMEILNLSACLLDGSEKPLSKKLLRRIKLTFFKIKRRTNYEHIWKEDDILETHSGDSGNDVMEATTNDDAPSGVSTGLDSYDFLPRSLKLEAEVDQVLQDLRKSQELEYKIAKETLQAQKTYLQSLYKQLDCEKHAWAGQNSSASNVSSSAVRERKKQIRREAVKFEIMKKVANGFARTSNSIIKEHFGLKVKD